MTKILEHAVAKAQSLPEAEQDALGAILLSMLDGEALGPDLDEETRAAIHQGLEQARRGEFVTDEDVAALWRRHGL
ncbi:hypothetical protein [Blastochloris sulfoviridis]|uniref:Addiction module protein n=1 Tax=Blastochloris sulfoviridis TaxID=50712 RepID=A0A5M6HQJ4_9HYPH|nr:hypothetical protein [Blastochloris sulfoviridis]KAA5598135.1 hypothetical protein F1193_13880 [Blastochloris sulfoviridis]